MNKKFHSRFLAVVALLSLCLTASPLLAQAWSIPYQGRLEKDGLPVNGDHEIRFSLFATATDPTALWTQTSTLRVSGGHFSAVLANVDAAAAQAAELYLSVEVKGPADADFVVLQNRQRILPALYAIRSAPQTDFYAADRVGVGVTAPDYPLDVRGTAAASGLVVNGDVTVVGSMRVKCPAGSHRVGTKCITRINPQAVYHVALETCNAIGMEICPLKTIMMCDSLWHAGETGPLDSWAGDVNECGVTTDGQEQYYWTADVYLRDYNSMTPGASTAEIFEHLACYRPTLTSTANIVYECAESNSFRYFCCGDVIWAKECDSDADCQASGARSFCCVPGAYPGLGCDENTCIECIDDTTCGGGVCTSGFCAP